MIDRFFSSLRVRLWLLVFLALIPALGLMLYTASEQRRLAAVDAQEDALRVARLASSSQERLVEGAHQLLVALAQVPEVRSGQVGECNAFLAGLLTRYPLYANFGLADVEGDFFCSALPLSSPVNIADRAFFRSVLTTGDFAVGEYQLGRVTGKPTLNFGYPLLGDAGQLHAVVVAALDLSWLTHLLAEAQLPEGAVLLVIDRTGTILARYPNPDVWVGRSGVDDPLFRFILTQGEGTTELPGVDGVPRLYAFTRLGGAAQAGYVSIGIPQEIAYAPADRMLARNLAGMGGVGALALAAAWVGADVFILRRVNALVRATKRLSTGDLSVRTGLPPGQGELSQLAQAFDDMAAALEWHEEQRLIEEQLRHQKEELEEQNRRVQEVNRLKTEFVTIVSHELRTPLTSIAGYVELLLAGEAGRLVQAQREYLGTVKNNADRLIELIEDLLDISRIEAGKVELHRTTLDLSQLIQEVAGLLRPQIEAKGQLLTLNLADALPVLVGDAKRVMQILTNLLSNAHKYTPPGGRITVTVRGEDGRVRVEVQDTGIGLSSDDQAQLFAKFFRAKNPATRQVGGTGLGLAITRSLVEMHGGEITVSSAPGQGSTFSFTLSATQDT
jgi:signal transduction histidine kinase